MTTRKTLVTRIVGQMLILAETEATPTDHEWDDFLNVLVAHRASFATLRILVVTDGGGPAAAQRKRLEAALGGQSVMVAVVTDSIKVRFIVSSVALLNHSISTFSRSEFAKAVAFLGLAPQEHRVAVRLIDEMRKELTE